MADVSANAADQKLEITASRLFVSWLAEQRASIAFSTYQVGKLFLIGLDEHGKLAVFNRTLARVMGLAAHDQSLWVATLWQLWRFENALQKGERHGAFDRYYVPQLAYTTGDIDVHDVAVDAAGEPVRDLGAADFALFEDGLHALDAGTVTVRAHAPVGAASVFKTLDRLQLSVSGTIEYLYTSLVSNPLGLNLTFDGVEHHVFTASGSTSVPAFTDSVRSVATLFVGNPVGGSTHARSSDLEITWVNGSADTTVYVVAAVVSQVDSSKVAMADMVRDAGEYTMVPAFRSPAGGSSTTAKARGSSGSRASRSCCATSRSTRASRLSRLREAPPRETPRWGPGLGRGQGAEPSPQS